LLTARVAAKISNSRHGNGWEKNFSVSTPQIKNSSATATVTLPSGETDKIKIDITLIKTSAGWRINKVACAD